MGYMISVGLMRLFGSVITYLLILDQGLTGFCGYLLAPGPNDCVEKEKKCPKYQEKF